MLPTSNSIVCQVYGDGKHFREQPGMCISFFTTQKRLTLV